MGAAGHAVLSAGQGSGQAVFPGRIVLLLVVVIAVVMVAATQRGKRN